MRCSSWRATFSRPCGRRTALSRQSSSMSSCSPGQSYVYETGYNVLLGYFGVQKDLLDLAKLFFFLTVALSAVFAMEQETGVAVLQTAAGANGRVLRRKLLLTAVLVLLMVTAAFLPRLLAVRGAYGLPEWGAQANSPAPAERRASGLAHPDRSGAARARACAVRRRRCGGHPAAVAQNAQHHPDDAHRGGHSRSPDGRGRTTLVERKKRLPAGHCGSVRQSAFVQFFWWLCIVLCGAQRAAAEQQRDAPQSCEADDRVDDGG